ncbi:MAG: hypothetical protein ATN35_01555 [Epulopiscium sp. Nele67-Bin004]|nr:MAG: hypothetical protein ATN35_01555 [Epulopiscium sp. Nele67-Bin004]
MKPFVKWVGGKTQLLPEIRTKYPKGLGVGIKKYCEPFIGGGAVLFDVISQYEFDSILINDINKELMNVYMQIKNNLDLLLEELNILQNEYWNLDIETRKIYFYKKRELFNNTRLRNSTAIDIKKSALFIFLNKTCFNGLYRVNKSGVFNVPMGSYKKPIICDEENLSKIHTALQNVTITTGDYRNCLSFIDENTFIYIDPPYRPISKTANFTSYTENDFNDDEQIALGDFIDEISQRNAKIILSNSDPKNHDDEDEFFDDLYNSYNISRISAKRMINCKGKNRNNVSELLISNF